MRRRNVMAALVAVATVGLAVVGVGRVAESLAVPVVSERLGGVGVWSPVAVPDPPKRIPSFVRPAGVAADVDLAPGGRVRAGASLISLDGSSLPVGSRPKLRVESLPDVMAARIGNSLLAFRVTPASAVARDGVVALSVDYSSFREAFGGDWESRLQLVRVPECLLVEPVPLRCGAPEVVPSKKDLVSGRLTADIPVVATAAAVSTAAVSAAAAVSRSRGEVVVAAAGGGGTYALTGATSGPAGSYTASSLSPSGKWDVGVSSGNFGWGYDVPLPAPVAGDRKSVV